MSNRSAYELFQDEAFEAVRDYLEYPHCAWENLEGDELAQFKRTMLGHFRYHADRKFQSHADCVRIVEGNCMELCWVIDVVLERIYEEELPSYNIDFVTMFNEYWQFILEATVDNWEGVLLVWENYTRPFSSDEEEEEDEEEKENNN